MRITHSRMMHIFQMMESIQLSMCEHTHPHTHTHRHTEAGQQVKQTLVSLISERTECVPF